MSNRTFIENNIKSFGKKIVVKILGWQVRRLQKKNNIITVGIVGSFGKTSTKFALAGVLKQKFKVRFQWGNYNDISAVPLVFFGEAMPSLLNPFAWFLLFIRNERQIRHKFSYDVVVLELGTDGPGQISQFKHYLRLNFAVVTSLSEEHMEFFPNLQAVADEELAVQHFSQQVIYNADLCPEEYVKALDTPTLSFGYQPHATYHIDDVKMQDNSYSFAIKHNKQTLLKATYNGVAKPQLYSACTATIVGHLLHVPAESIVSAISDISPVSGRMLSLKGIHGSTILDETYNSSPLAAIAALNVLYEIKAPQKIALLGNMNELGAFSESAHKNVGKHCNPEQLDLLLTLGPDANTYLADAAEKNGCKVIRCQTPYEAGDYLKKHIKHNALILAKGSQNNVFAEEAVKTILADPSDSSLLVRQSSEWLKQKKLNFK